MHLPFRDYGTLLARYLRAQRGKVALLTLLLFASIGLQLINPQIVSRFFDAAQAGSALNALLGLALLFLLAALLQYALSLGVTYLGEDVGWRTTNALRADLTAHCLRLDMSFHHRHTPGVLIERVDGDVGLLAHFFSQLLLRLAGNFLLILGILMILSAEDWRLGIGFLVFVLGAFVILFWLRDFATPAMKASRAANADLFGFLEERLGGTEDIRANGAVAYTLQRFFGHLRALWQTGVQATARSAIFGSVIVVWYELAAVLALALGAYLFQRNAMSIGTVYLLYAYLRMLNGPLLSLTWEIRQLQEANASLARIHELFGEPRNVIDGAQTTLPGGALPVRFDGVGFNYGQTAGEPVLDNFSLHLPAGRKLGLLGRTGSGKTTITRLLLRLYDPQTGAVRLGDVNLRDLSLAAVRRHVGIVTQDVQLFNATVRDNLTFFEATITDAAITDALTTVGLGDWLAALPEGLETKLAPGGSGLSAGEAQLFAFVRAFLHDPGLVILDEASSRLDPATEQRLEQAIDYLLKGRTAIIIAHRLTTVGRADQIMILEQGRCVEFGPRRELATTPDSLFAGLLRTGLEEALA